MPLRLCILLALFTVAGSPAAATEPAATTAADSAVIELGKKVYLQQRCKVCHSIDGDGGKHSLDGVGSRLDREKIRLWIVAPKEVDPKVRKRAYDRLAPEELEALLAYMISLR